MKLFKKAKKGFTLVELVVVIAVIAILAAVSVGAYFGVTDSANRSKLEQEAKAAYDSIRLVSLADPENNQGLDIDGLHVRNNDQGIPTFQNDLVYTTGIGYTVDDEIPMVDGTPTISGKVIVLRNDVYTESAFSSTAYNTYKSFDYYTDEVGSYFANVSIINGKINILKADFETVTPDPETPVKALGSLKVEGELDKKTYLEGDDIDLTGLIFKAVYSDSTETDVTSSVVVSNPTLELNTTSVTVSYTENNVTKTTSVTGFTVNKVVFQELVVEGTAADTEYFEGESFNLEGLTFYEKNNRGDVDRENPIPHANLTVSPAELTYNTRQVTISYSKDNVTDSYTVDINVQKIVPDFLTVSGELTVKNYFVGETLSLEGLTFTATYNNQTTKNVTSEVTAESLVLASQQEKVIVSYSHNDVTVPCDVKGFTVTDIVADTLTVSGELTKKEYIDGDYIDLSGLSFKVTNNNGDEYDLTPEQIATITSEPLSAGDTEVTVTYNANGTEVSCLVSGFTTDGIKVIGLVKEGTLNKDEYFDNETFDPSGLTFYATFNKGERQDVTDQVTFSDLAETITATYVHETGTVTCQITDITVTKIVPVELKVSDVQTTYYVGDTLESIKTGRTFEVKYNNSDDYTTVDASRVTVSGNVTAGEQTITFSFEDCDTTVTATKTVTFISVELKEELKVEGTLSKTEYIDGETLDLTGLKFKAEYNDSRKDKYVEVTAPVLSENDTSATVSFTENEQTATYTFTGLTVSSKPADIYKEKTYIFSDYSTGTQFAQNEIHQLDSDLELTVNGGHLNGEMRIYKGSNIVLSFAENIVVKSLTFNGIKKGPSDVKIYGINNDKDTLIETIAMSSGSSYSTSKNDYNSYSKFKIEAIDAQVQVTSLTVVATNLTGGVSLIDDIETGVLGWRLVTDIEQLGMDDKIILASKEFSKIAANEITDGSEINNIDNPYFSSTGNSINGIVDDSQVLILTVGGKQNAVTLKDSSNKYLSSSVTTEIEFTGAIKSRVEKGGKPLKH